MKTTYEIVTEQILKLMESNENPWTKPWVTQSLSNQRNLGSMRPYSGLNALILSLQNKKSDYWLTFNQAREFGFQIKFGSKATLVIGWFKSNKKTEVDEETGEVVISGGGLRARFYRVFNLSDFENVPQSILDKTKRPEVEAFSTETLPQAENLIKASGAKIEFGVEQALYNRLSDKISMPDRNRFPLACEYYSTLFHELGHWTGHVSRLNRAELQKVNLFNNTARSQEELCAEMASVFVCSSLGISSESALRNSSAYIKSWLNFLKSNPKAFVIACQQASKAADFILEKKGE